MLDERIDVVFVRNNFGFLPFSVTGPTLGLVIGDEPILPVRPRWSADHAGPLMFLPRLIILD